MRQGQGGSPFRAFLRGLPDEIEKARLRELPVCFPVEAIPSDEGSAKYDSIVALLETLGVTLTRGGVPLPAPFLVRRVEAALGNVSAGDERPEAEAWLLSVRAEGHA